jgi:glycosyltransferase involved in cell wall biosynthesis
MNQPVREGSSRKLRVLYSFPHKIGASRICTIAWHQVVGVATGADVLACPGVVHRELPEAVTVRPTLARGPVRIPYRVLGRVRACALHDRIVASRLEKLAGKVDVVHAWPLGARETLRVAARLGIPTLLERPNAHTRYAQDVVQRECARLGVDLPPDHEHAPNPEVLRVEEEEYALADYLLCPSEFVVRTFVDQGVAREKLVRHTYGFNERDYYPDTSSRNGDGGLRMLFAGVCAVRKGLHFALEAWLSSAASRHGTFLIAGEFLPTYRQKLERMLAHPSVRVLGHRNDLPELMRQSDALVLPSIEEGFGLVCADAIASGCVPLVSDACTEVCRHMENALVHRVADVDALTRHITLLHDDRRLLHRLRTSCLADRDDLTWSAAGRRLLEAYGTAHRVGRFHTDTAHPHIGPAA